MHLTRSFTHLFGCSSSSRCCCCCSPSSLLLPLLLLLLLLLPKLLPVPARKERNEKQSHSARQVRNARMLDLIARMDAECFNW